MESENIGEKLTFMPETETAQAAASALAQYKHSVEWGILGISYVFSSAASALSLIKTALMDGKRPDWWLVLTSATISGLLAIAVVAWMSDYDASLGKKITISILAGFSGDALLRVLISTFLKFVKASGTTTNIL